MRKQRSQMYWRPFAESYPMPSLLWWTMLRSEEHTSELQSRLHLVCRLLLEKKNTNIREITSRVFDPRGSAIRTGSVGMLAGGLAPKVPMTTALRAYNLKTTGTLSATTYAVA